MLSLVDFKSSTINTSERRNGSETYGEFLKVLLEDSWPGKARWSEQAGGRISRDAVRLQYTPTIARMIIACLYLSMSYSNRMGRKCPRWGATASGRLPRLLGRAWGPLPRALRLKARSIVLYKFPHALRQFLPRVVSSRLPRHNGGAIGGNFSVGGLYASGRKTQRAEERSPDWSWEHNINSVWSRNADYDQCSVFWERRRTARGGERFRPRRCLGRRKQELSLRHRHGARHRSRRGDIS